VGSAGGVGSIGLRLAEGWGAIREGMGEGGKKLEGVGAHPGK
jgi:hypothetical protein